MKGAIVSMLPSLILVPFFFFISFSPFSLLLLLRCSLLFPSLFYFYFYVVLVFCFLFLIFSVPILKTSFLFLTKKSHEDLAPPPKQASWSDPPSVGSRRRPFNNNVHRHCKANRPRRQAPTTTPAKRGTRTTDTAPTATAPP